MKREKVDRWGSSNARAAWICGLGLLMVAGRVVAEPAAGAIVAFDSYVRGVESRLAVQHASRDAFLVPVAADRLRQGELVIEEIKPAGVATLPGAMLHHWRGTAFAPGATAADFERLMRNFSEYPQVFRPEVLRASVVAERGDQMQVVMRVRQTHVITVVMDTAYDVTFGRLDAHHGFSVSRSTRIAEIDAPGTAKEHALSAGEEHGFLWRQETYWSYEERDGGLYMQVESVSLSRSIPTGLGWAVGPFVEGVPRDSMEFMLRATCNALRKPAGRSGE